MKFTFSLQAILELEESEKKSLETQLLELKMRQKKVKEIIDKEKKELENLNKKCAKTCTNICDFKNKRIYISDLNKKICKLKEKENIYQKGIDKLIKAISFKSEKIKKLNKMKNEQYAEYKKKIENKEEKRLEDLISARKFYDEKYEKEA